LFLALGGGGDMTLDPKHLAHIQTFAATPPFRVLDRQMPLRARYQEAPDAAWVNDHARTSDAQIPAHHPIHTHVACGECIPVDIPVSVHQAVGGESDFPCPGELLAAALASCLDTAIRMIANLKGIELQHLEVHVSLGADVRGALMTGDNVPVGFQSARMKVEIEAANDLPEAQLSALLDAAERSCVILQTLRAPPAVHVERCMCLSAIKDC
jgi:uncharacterized OsmC-like protein